MTDLETVTNDLIEAPLSQTDGETTISANANTVENFQNTQAGVVLLGDALTASAEQIEGIGERFFDIDDQAAGQMGF